MNKQRQTGMFAILAMLAIFTIVVAAKSNSYSTGMAYTQVQNTEEMISQVLTREGCVDPDGLNAYKAVTSTFTQAVAGGTVVTEDRCLNSNTVLERYCNGKKLESQAISCRQGTSCTNGA